jgi:hypothetical protein
MTHRGMRDEALAAALVSGAAAALGFLTVRSGTLPATAAVTGRADLNLPQRSIQHLADGRRPAPVMTESRREVALMRAIWG